MKKTAEKLSRKKLEQMADPRSFERGEDYFENGRVRVIAEEEGSFSAKVQGSHNYRVKIEDVVETIHGLVKEGYAEEGIELTEYFIEKAEKSMGEVDDSNGEMGDILQQLQEIHHEACQKEKPDPVVLAKRLFDWEIKTDYDTFYDAAKTYADVLGEKGLAEYRRLADKEWSNTPHLKSGQDRSDRYADNRFQITHIMESLAEQDGDSEALVAI